MSIKEQIKNILTSLKGTKEKKKEIILAFRYDHPDSLPRTKKDFFINDNDEIEAPLQLIFEKYFDVPISDPTLLECRREKKKMPSWAIEGDL